MQTLNLSVRSVLISLVFSGLFVSNTFAAVIVLDDHSRDRTSGPNVGSTNTPTGFRSGAVSNITGNGSVTVDYNYVTFDEDEYWSVLEVDFRVRQDQELNFSLEGQGQNAFGGPGADIMSLDTNSVLYSINDNESLVLTPGDYKLTVSPVLGTFLGGFGEAYQWMWNFRVDFSTYVAPNTATAFDVLAPDWNDVNGNGVVDPGEFSQLAGLGFGAGLASQWSDGDLLAGLFGTRFIGGPYVSQVYLPDDFDIEDINQFVGDPSSIVDMRVVPLPASGILFFSSGLVLAAIKRNRNAL